MTSENPQIQTLLQQINEVLNQTNPRLPWVMSSDAVRQRQVLEQTREYLLALQQNGTPETAVAETDMASQSAAAMEASAQQVLQAVVQEMNYLRSNMMQPLRSDVEMLRIQRDALTQEIRQLEAQRQQYGLPQQNPQYLTEFLQAAMTQMQQSLVAQVAQMLVVSPDSNSERLTGAQTAGLLTDSDMATLSPAQRLERLQRMQAQSDQLILRLDTTLRTVFESLQHNLQSYQDSLEEGLGRMHGMGQQSEAVFGAFVTRLGQILGREASSFLQSPQTWSDRPSLPGQRNASEKRPDPQISRLLEELGALDQTVFGRAAAGEPIPFDLSSQGLSSDAELANLEALDRVLSQLDLSAIPDADELNNEFTEELDTEELDDDLDLLQEPDSPFPGFNEPRRRSSLSVETDPDLVVLRSDQVKPDEELDSAIDLLNQITDETPIANPPIDHRQETAQTETDLSVSPSTSSLASEPPLVEDPDVLYGDEFYQTLLDETELSETEPRKTEAGRADVKQAEAALIDRPDLEESVQPIAQPDEELKQTDAPVELDTDLFAGLNALTESDSLPSSNGLPSSHPAIGVTDLPQSVENQLLQPPQSFPPQETLDAFFNEPEAENQPEENQPEAEEIETIAALTDLIPSPLDTSSSNTLPSDAPVYAEPPRLLDFGGDYRAARSEADLFGPEFEAESTADAQLPPDPLQPLSADLFDLEDRQPDTASRSDQASRTQGKWQDAPSVNSPAVEPIYTGIEWSIADIPSVLLSQPYAGEMTAEDLFRTGEVDSLADQSLDATSESDSTSADSDLPADSQPEDPATELLSSTIEDWFSTVESNVDPSAAEQSPATDEIDSLNAFTLDGLENLFEGVPSIDTPGTAPPSETNTQTVTVDNIFGDWQDSPAAELLDREDDRSIDSSSAFPEAPSSPEGNRQKKKFGFFRKSTD